MTILFIILALLAAIIWFFLQHDKLGAKPRGQRLERMKKSPNFKNGAFQTLSPTTMLTPGYSYWGVFYNALFKSSARKRPKATIPSVKTDLKSIAIDSNVLIWFGHSSYFMQIDGRRFLIDPVFSGNASPIPGTNKSFGGTDIYTVDDLPNIDYLFISHDHYDHLDYETILKLNPKTGKVICGLGVGSHFEAWGYEKERIIEKDWHDTIDLDGGFFAFVTPARHFSGRGLFKNNTLWCSYLLQTPSMKIYIGGDSGYDTHFANIGEKFGPIDFAILDNGQYNVAWRAIHTLPDEVLKVAKDLRAKRILPVHSSKFALANHAWDEPLVEISALNINSENPVSLVTPMIGEVVFLNEEKQGFKEWWTRVEISN
jgi:L-ascorbate metabolism protein UlaG (beta-lactamase superfamily)